MLERNITRRIMQDLNNTPECKAIKIIGGRFTETGTPDIIGCYCGRLFAIEVKAPRKAPSRIQAYRMIEWCEAGGVATIATADFSVEQFLKDISGKE